jgi:hypothetical protein
MRARKRQVLDADRHDVCVRPPGLAAAAAVGRKSSLARLPCWELVAARSGEPSACACDGRGVTCRMTSHIICNKDRSRTRSSIYRSSIYILEADSPLTFFPIPLRPTDNAGPCITVYHSSTTLLLHSSTTARAEPGPIVNCRLLYVDYTCATPTLQTTAASCLWLPIGATRRRFFALCAYVEHMCPYCAAALLYYAVSASRPPRRPSITCDLSDLSTCLDLDLGTLLSPAASALLVSPRCVCTLCAVCEMPTMV